MMFVKSNLYFNNCATGKKNYFNFLEMEGVEKLQHFFMKVDFLKSEMLFSAGYYIPNNC
jgi:hypothetical protein